MRITYAPASVHGVSAIMGLGDTAETAVVAPTTPSKAAEKAKVIGWLSVAVWGVGMLSGSSTIKNAAIGAAVASFLAAQG